jgi:hypothetical protein
VPKEQRLKLDDKVISCMFFGYGDAELRNKLWDPKKKEDDQKSRYGFS